MINSINTKIPKRNNTHLTPMCHHHIPILIHKTHRINRLRELNLPQKLLPLIKNPHKLVMPARQEQLQFAVVVDAGEFGFVVVYFVGWQFEEVVFAPGE